jgi:hypothetical protein
MPRQSVTFTEPQLQWLQQEASALAISVGEYVRRIVDDERASETQALLRKTTRKVLKQRIAKERAVFIKEFVRG